MINYISSMLRLLQITVLVLPMLVSTQSISRAANIEMRPIDLIGNKVDGFRLSSGFSHCINTSYPSCRIFILSCDRKLERRVNLILEANGIGIYWLNAIVSTGHSYPIYSRDGMHFSFEILEIKRTSDGLGSSWRIEWRPRKDNSVELYQILGSNEPITIFAPGYLREPGIIDLLRTDAEGKDLVTEFANQCKGLSSNEN